MTSAAAAVLAWTLAAGELPPAAVPPPAPEPLPAPETLAPSTPLVPARTALVLAALAGTGASASDVDRWRGYGGSLSLDLFFDGPPPAVGMAWFGRLVLEGGEYGGVASIGGGLFLAYGPLRPYVTGMIGLGVFASEPGVPISLGAGLELALGRRLSLRVEGRAHLFAYEDEDGQPHAFAGVAALAGIAVRL